MASSRLSKHETHSDRQIPKYADVVDLGRRESGGGGDTGSDDGQSEHFGSSFLFVIV
jgi:hypothetical protein